MDTGANITIVKSRIWEQLPPSDRPLLEGVDVTMVLANGSSAPFLGRGTFSLRVEDQQTQHTTWVADIQPDGILGLDFMRANGCQLIREDDGYRLTVGDGEREPHLAEPSVYRVAIDQTTVLPAGGQADVPAKLIDGGFTEELGLLEAAPRLVATHQVLLARGLVHPKEGIDRVRLFNPSSLPLTVHQGTIAGHVTSVAEVYHPQRCENAHVATTRTTEDQQRAPECRRAQMPDHLTELLSRSQASLDDHQGDTLASLVEDYADVFSTSRDDIGRTSVTKHTIDTGDARPIRQPARRLPLHKKTVAEQEVSRMLERGVIEPSSSPWAAPVVLVRKKDGSTRFCIDYRKLNEVTVKDSYPLPRTDDCLDSLAGSSWFSTLDLSSGYWQVEMDANDKEKTAFTAGSGLYQFTVMPFGLCNAPATFERLMERVLAGLSWHLCLLYLDDIIVHAPTLEEHIRRLRLVLDRLRAAGLKLSPKKCHLLQREVEFLGHVVNDKGVATDPKKVEAVSNWPVPQSPKDVRSFLGLCGYYRRFVRDFSRIAKPLHHLTEKGQQFQWTAGCQEAFDKLKSALTTAPVLAYPTRDDQFVLDTDASNTGTGAVLSQVQDGDERAIAYYSKTLNKAERNYCTTRKELLAIITAVRHFHHYLYGRPFLVRTDHGALRWLLNFKNPDGQLARWLETLAAYDFAIEHRPGRKHVNADILSRRPCGECKFCERAEERMCKTDEGPITAQREAEGSSGPSNDPGGTVRGAQTRGKAAPSPPHAATWLQSTTAEDLRTRQLEDPDLRVVIGLKEAAEKRPQWESLSFQSPMVKAYWAQWDRLQLRDGALYRRWESETGDEVRWQLLVPSSMKAEVFTQLHDGKTAGHLGVNKTIERVKERFYWLGCSRDAKDWCKRCGVCASRRGPRPALKAPMKTYNVGAPLERVALDVMGPLPVSDRGNRYILVIGDYFSKWKEAYAIPDQTAPTVARVVVEEFVARFGVPRQMHSDQGRNFESAVFQEMCHLLDIDKTRTTPLRPQSDGMVERFNQTMEAMLSKFVSDNQTDWDEHLPLLMMAYRSAEHDTTGFSPSELMLGRQVQLPVDILFGRPDPEPRDTSDYASDLRRRMERVHTFARDNIKLASERQKRLYDHRARRRRFKRGDAVRLHNPRRKKGVCPKLTRPWEGPYIVLDCLDDMVYRVQRSAKAKPKVVHIDRLKPFEGPVERDWLLKQPEKSPQKCSVQPKGDVANPEPSAEGPGNTRPRRTHKPPAWATDYELDLMG